MITEPSAPKVEELDERLYLQSVGRAFSVIECFRGAHRHKSLNEIAADLGITKSAAQRTIYTLLAHGYLEKAEGSGYRLGRVILDCAFDYLRMNSLVERAAPVLTELRRHAGERIDMSLFDDDTIVFALRYQSKRESFYSTLPGRRLPSFASPGGRACFSCLDDSVARDIVARSSIAPLTSRTITDIEGIMEKVEDARRDSFACAAEEIQMGEVEVAAAILNQHRRPVGAVHISGLLSDWSVEEFRNRFAPLALEAVRELHG